MITYRSGNLLVDTSEALVNPVNCVGVMGAAVALQFKRTFPAASNRYIHECRQNKVLPGKMFVTDMRPDGDPCIIHFPTKSLWILPSELRYVEKGMIDLRDTIVRMKLESVAMPALGCGCGGLRWLDVKAIINSYLGDLENVDIRIYEPQD